MRELADQIFSYLRGVWRFRWVAVVVAWLVAICGWVVVGRLPDRYEASARVYVDTETILKPLLTGLTVQPDTKQIVEMVSHTMVSRPHLEKLIHMAGLETNLKGKDEREALFNRLSKTIVIGSTAQRDLYTISYEGWTPLEAKRVVQSLLTIFKDESLNDKYTDSESAQRFIDEQLKTYGEKLKTAEDAVMAFKRRNAGLLPSEGQGFYARLRDAEDNLRKARLELREAVNSRDATKQQLANYRELRASQASGAGAVGVSPELDARLADLEKKLDGLRVTYTDQHPDVIALQRLISHLKEERAAEAKKWSKPAATSAPPDLGYQQLLVALSDAEAKVAALRARVTEHEARHKEYEAVAAAMPKVEAEYTQLTRDYDVLKTRYDKLLERRESAQMSGQIEQKAMGFRVVDPPRVPLGPSWPNRPLFMSLVLLAALGSGVGVAFLISQLRPTLDSEYQLREVSGLPVLGTVAMDWTETQKAQRRRGIVAFLMSLAGLLSAYAAIMASLVLAVARG